MSMNIRIAIPEDRLRVVRLLKDSMETAGFAEGIAGPGDIFKFPFEAVYACKLFDQHLYNPDAIVMVYTENDSMLKREIIQGVLMAVASEHHFGPVMVARETVWYIAEKYRGGSAAIRMLDYLIDWAKVEKKCRYLGMAGMGVNPRVASLYARKGFSVAETYYLKPLEHLDLQSVGETAK